MRPTVRMSGYLKVSGNAFQRRNMHRHKPNLVAFAMNANVFDAPAVQKIPHLQTAEFLAPQTVIKKHRQNRPVTFALQCAGVGRIEQCAGLRPSPIAGVLPSLAPSLGRFTPSTGL